MSHAELKGYLLYQISASFHTCISMASIPMIIQPAWNTSVHITAFMPP